MDRLRLRIAVIDDDESVRKALKRLLRAANLDADTYASGREFLDSLATQVPDCIVLDLHMPGMNGLEVQQQLARGGLRLPIVSSPGMTSRRPAPSACPLARPPISANRSTTRRFSMRSTGPWAHPAPAHRRHELSGEAGLPE